MSSSMPLDQQSDDPPDESGEPLSLLDSPSATPRPWYALWVDAIVHPYTQTYTELLNEPDHTPRRAILWCYILNVAGVLVLLPMLSRSPLLAGQDNPWPVADLVGLACVTTIAPLIACGRFLVGVFLENLFATSVFHGQGAYWDLAFAKACFAVPLSVILQTLYIFLPAISIGLFPAMGCVVGILVLAGCTYTIMLDVTAIRAVHEIKWIEAIISSMFSVGIMVLLACGLGLWGAALSELMPV